MKTKKQHDVKVSKLCSLIKEFTTVYGTDNSRWLVDLRKIIARYAPTLPIPEFDNNIPTISKNYKYDLNTLARVVSGEEGVQLLRRVPIVEIQMEVERLHRIESTAARFAEVMSKASTLSDAARAACFNVFPDVSEVSGTMSFRMLPKASEFIVLMKEVRSGRNGHVPFNVGKRALTNKEIAVVQQFKEDFPEFDTLIELAKNIGNIPCNDDYFETGHWRDYLYLMARSSNQITSGRFNWYICTRG